MSTHEFSPYALLDVFVAHPIDPAEPLPHGLSQVGMAGDWNRGDVLTLGALMDHPERYLVALSCRGCDRESGGSES